MENTENVILHDNTMEEKAAQVLARREAEKQNESTLSPEAQAIAAQHIPGGDRDNSMKITADAVTSAAQDFQFPTERSSASPYTNIPQPVTSIHPAVSDSDVIPPPPSDAEMQAAGFKTATDETTIIKRTDTAGSQGVNNDIEDEAVIITRIAKDNTSAMPASAQDEFIANLIPDIAKFRKDLVINEGYTPEEATQAARNRAQKKTIEADTKYSMDNPAGVILTIDKTQEDQLNLSEEEERKIHRATALKLIVVENTDLETIKVLPRNQTTSMSAIRNICGSLSQYSVPLPGLGDYVTFFGAQSAVLAGTTADEDDSAIDVLDKKATLLFNYFGGGSVISKRVKNDKGEEHDITYEEFCNIYKYEDVDMGIFAIVCASSMEITNTTYECRNQQCHRPYEISYNQKALLDMSEIPDIYKDRVTFIDDNRASMDKLKTLHEACMKHTRVKSPMSKNIYELYSPSIADARHVMENCMDLVDGRTALDIAMLMYLDRIYVYDAVNDGYIEIDVRLDPRLAFDALCRVHQIDLELLFHYLGDHIYRPVFKLKTVCPHCKREEVDDIGVDNMVFLHARATLMEIAQ